MALLTFDADTFEQRVLAGKEPAVISFLTDWCGPCGLQRKTFQRLADEEPADSPVLIGGIDADQCGALCDRFGVRTLPSTLIFAEGEVLEMLVGYQSGEYLKSYVEYLAREKAGPKPDQS